MKNNNELLEKYLRNERRNQWLTTVMVFIFIIMAISIIFYAVKTDILNKDLNNKKEQIGILADSISRQVIADSLRRTSLEAENKKLLTAVDSLIKLLPVYNNNVAFKMQETVNQLRLNKANSATVIYIQYRNDSERKKIEQLAGILRKKGFVVAKPEKVQIEFASTIKYFNESDSNMAKVIESIIKKETSFKNVRLSEHLYMNVPRKQVEIWINTNTKIEIGTNESIVPPSIEKKLPTSSANFK